MNKKNIFNISLLKIYYKRKIILFLIGILFGLLGFSLAFENDIPIVSHMVYNELNSLKLGFNKVCGMPVKIEVVNDNYRQVIIGDLKLDFEEEGFKELSTFLLKDLKKKQPNFFHKTDMPFNEYKEKAIHSGFSKITYLGIPGNGQGINIPISNNKIRVYLANGSPSEYADFFVYKILEGIEKKHRATTFAWSSIIYFLGLLIQILQFDWCEKKST